MTGDTSEMAAAWLAVDPDADTQLELALLIERGGSVLADRFSTRLEFGTAGLRGELGAGPSRMNRVLVRMAAAGVSACVRGGPVIVGYDARHKSRVFAQDTARVLAARGIDTLVMPGPLPTPLIAYAVRHYAAAAGVMVTASHNPRGDNGFKVYWHDGAQISPPVDREISAAIDAAGLLGETDLAATDDPRIGSVDDEVITAYLAAVCEPVNPRASRDVTVAYTPLHGIGRDLLVEAFARAGFSAPFVVTEQGDPDPEFPTTPFPNPEEPGVLDRAVALGVASGADLVLANDPDADRLAVAVLDREEPRTLTGDEIGVLLADYILTHTDGPDRLVVTTIVSSSLLGSIAAHHGVEHQRTLTGFKWVMRPAIDRDDARFVFGYEEALGFAVGDAVRDKDGIRAAVVFAEMAAAEKEAGRSVLDRLDDLHHRHGVHHTAQRSLRFDGGDGLRQLDAIMQYLRAVRPDRIGTRAVERFEDLGMPTGARPATNAVAFELTGPVRLLVRPSGTEPKIKLYGEAGLPPANDLDKARATAASSVATALGDLMTLIDSLIPNDSDQRTPDIIRADSDADLGIGPLEQG